LLERFIINRSVPVCSVCSCAAHDAQVLAPKLASGMIFVPSIGGISYDFNEDTAEEDIILGCQVMAAAVEAILQDEVEKC